MNPSGNGGTGDGGADAVLARVMSEQVDPEPVAGRATLAKAPDTMQQVAPTEAGQHHSDVLSSVPGGPDGQDIHDGVGGFLDYLSRLAQQLGVPDPVEEYFAPVVGRWSDLHAEAERWRAAAKASDTATTALSGPLGSLDTAWRGRDAEAFVQYMGRFGLAGHDMADAMNGMAQALDKTANGIREIVQQLAGVLADTAETASHAMTAPGRGEHRVRAHLDDARRPGKDLFDAVRQVLEAFVRLCDGIDGGKSFDNVTMKHTFPEQNFAFPEQRQLTLRHPDGNPSTHMSSTDTGSGGSSSGSGGGGGGSSAIGGGGGAGGGSGAGSGAGGGSAGAGSGGSGGGSGGSMQPGEFTGVGGQQSAAGAAPAAASAAGAGGRGQTGGQSGFGGMPMGAMGGGQGGGDQEHKRSSRVVGDPADIFGKPNRTSPAVIGDDE